MKTTVKKIGFSFESNVAKMAVTFQNEAGKLLAIECAYDYQVTNIENVSLVTLARICLYNKIAELREGVISFDESARRQAGKLKSFFGEELFMQLWTALSQELVLDLLLPPQVAAASPTAEAVTVEGAVSE